MDKPLQIFGPICRVGKVFQELAPQESQRAAASFMTVPHSPHCFGISQIMPETPVKRAPPRACVLFRRGGAFSQSQDRVCFRRLGVLERPEDLHNINRFACGRAMILAYCNPLGLLAGSAFWFASIQAWSGSAPGAWGYEANFAIR